MIVLFNAWIDQMLCPLLDDRHVVIMIMPPSSDSGIDQRSVVPELNPIEKDFANLKRIREYNAEATLDQIIKVYQ